MNITVPVGKLGSATNKIKNTAVIVMGINGNIFGARTMHMLKVWIETEHAKGNEKKNNQNVVTKVTLEYNLHSLLTCWNFI